MPTLPTGFPCVYLPGGDPSHAIPSQCRNPRNGTCLDIVSFPSNAGTREHRSIYHKSDIIFQRQPHRLAEDGCWDYVKDLVPPEPPAPLPPPGTVDKPVAAAKPDNLPTPSEMDDLCWKLSLDNTLSASEIAEKIGHGWTKLRVGKVLKRKRDKLAGAY